MKVERKQPAFEPVIITIESEDELNYLWHCLNVDKSDIESLSISSEIKFPRNVDDKQMWEALDEIVRPKK